MKALKLEPGEYVTGNRRDLARKLIQDAIDNGKTEAEIANAFNRSVHWVHRVLAKTRIHAPQVVGAERATLSAEMRERYEAGASIAEIGREFGHPKTTTRALLLDSGVQLRPRGARPSGDATSQPGRMTDDHPS